MLLRSPKIFLVVLIAFISLPLMAVQPLSNRLPTSWLDPEVLNPNEHKIGQIIEDIGFEHLSGGEGRLHQTTGDNGTVVFVRDPTCPVSIQYGPRMADFVARYQKKGINFVFIYLNDLVGLPILQRDRNRLNTSGTFVAKGSFGVAGALSVNSTGDAFVLDNDNRLVYRGAIDNQFGLGFTRDEATRLYLRSALNALLSGEEIKVPATSAPGCFIDADPSKNEILRSFPNEEALG